MFFNSVFLIIVLLNLKYFFLPLQVIYTSLAIPFFAKNDCYAPVQKIVSATKQIKDFQDEGQIGFVSDVENAVVFDIADSINRPLRDWSRYLPKTPRANCVGREVPAIAQRIFPQSR